jgi:hypothetical protein
MDWQVELSSGGEQIRRNCSVSYKKYNFGNAFLEEEWMVGWMNERWRDRRMDWLAINPFLLAVKKKYVSKLLINKNVSRLWVYVTQIIRVIKSRRRCQEHVAGWYEKCIYKILIRKIVGKRLLGKLKHR